ncbi:MAG: SprT-like domain-containing protein [Chloroflexota bacterium]|nr:SprT-like domain-containing protein [Chloroflexota bacterium]
MISSLIRVTPTGTGCVRPMGGLAGIRSAIKIRRSILDGTCLELKHGSRNPKGCRLFLEDVLLHEMINRWQLEVVGDSDASYSGHGPVFSAKANEISKALGLSIVGRTCKARDHKAKNLPSPSQWPHNTRPVEYYLGAYAPVEAVRASKDKQPNGSLDAQIQALVARYGIEKVYEATLTLQVQEWERELDLQMY